MNQTPKNSLLDAFKKILRPFIGVLLRNGVSIAEFIELIKTAFVEVSANDFEVPGKKMSQSRVAIVTGLTRKEVARVIKEEHRRLYGYEGSPQGRAARVLLGWHMDDDFIGPYGTPNDLHFDSKEELNFSDLVRRHSGDMPARAMLDELLRIGAVEETKDGLYRVLMRTYIPPNLAPGGLELMQKALADFHQTVIINLEKKVSGGVGRFQRTVWADEKLTEAELVDFENFVRVSGQKYLEEMDDWLGKKIARRTSDFVPSNAKIAGAGVYHFVRSDSRFQELTEIFGGYYDEQEDD
ncbi:MAG: DUF6502 family protein [Proteobacteria bacterium]|nr:DUF6502 family protein [Pseudomonadota bacterium]